MSEYIWYIPKKYQNYSKLQKNACRQKRVKLQRFFASVKDDYESFRLENWIFKQKGEPLGVISLDENLWERTNGMRSEALFQAGKSLFLEECSSLSLGLYRRACGKHRNMVTRFCSLFYVTFYRLINVLSILAHLYLHWGFSMQASEILSLL